MTQALSLILWFVTHVMWQNAPCLPGGIEFTRQGQVDSFNILYPGCDQVTGDLVVNGNIARLDSLYRIKAVGGNMSITNTTTLKNLNGLGNLQSIGLRLTIINNKQLTFLAGLQALTNLGGELIIDISDSLKDISAISQLAFDIHQRITISNCPKLAICNVASICQFLNIGGTLIAQNNATGCATRYQVVKACNPGLLCPSADIILKSQADIQDFALNFPGCRQLSGSLTLSSNEGDITSLSALPKFTSIAKSLSISYILSQNLSGLDSLKTIGLDCRINFNSRIKNLNGLTSLQWINQTLEIGANDSITSLQGLGPIRPDSLASLSIYNNPRLTVCSHASICSFLSLYPRLSSIDFNGPGCSTYLQVYKNCYPEAQCPPDPLLLRGQQSINEFYTLYPNCRDFPGTIEIFSEFIKNLDSLYKLNSISGDLIISDNDSIINLNGLSGLKSVGGQVSIRGNDLMTSLDGLDSLQMVGKEFYTNSNNSLQNVSALKRVQFNPDINAVYFIDNPLLSVCNAPSICAFIEIDGFVGLSRNAPGCSSFLQLLKSCRPELICPPGDVFLISQEEIEDFATFYPNCSEISGVLTIKPDDNPITDLSPLNKIRSVSGGLNILHTQITNLNGLDSLLSVKGNMHIEDNNRLRSLTELSGLEILSGLYVTENDSLVNLNGLNSLNPDSLIYLNIHNNPLLAVCAQEKICSFLSRPNAVYDIGENAPGCNTYLQIISACGVQCLPGSLIFHTQSELNEILLFPNCTAIGGGIEIGPSDGPDPITSLAPLSKIKSIAGDLDIEINPRLKSLTGLDSLQSIGGHLQIGVNDSMLNLTGLGSLKSISGSLLIQQNARMTNLSGLGNTKIDNIASIFIEDNPVLTMCGVEPICNYLFPVNIALVFQNNASGCNALAQVRAACGIVVCGENSDINLLTQADVDNFPKNFPGCEHVSQGLFISGANITNLDSLRQIKHVGFYLNVTANPSLTSITGLSNMETVGSDLDISNNPLLQSAQGLSSLKSIGGYLGIYTNYSLSSLGNIDQLDYKTISELYIQENQKLSICNIPPVCSFINDPANVDVTFVDHNKSGCETPNQIKSACGLATCPTGNITLTTQTQVNQFRSLMLDCTILPGDLTITGTDITYLDSLSVLSGINGQLRIENTSLHSLFGLDALMATSVNHLVIQNNPSLATCDVRSICDYISLPAKTYEISDNAPTCTSVSAVMAECGKTCFRDGLIFTTQAQVDAFTGPCEFIPGTVYIDGSGIVSLDSLYKIKTIGGAFTIANTSLTSLHGLESLQSIGSLLDIRNNGSLTNLDGLQNLKESGAAVGATIRVLNNAQLTSINGLKRIKKAYFNLIIQLNNQLTNLSGLDSVESVTNTLIISNNASLTSTAALRSLTRVNNDLRIENNAQLAEADGFESLKYIGFDMRILNNGQLNTLRAFTSLDSVRNLLRIEGNNGMDSIVGLTGLDFIGRGLRIQNNNTLKNINSLSQLTEVIRELTINNNDALTSLQGLDRLNPLLLTQLSIQNSAILNLCNVRSVCNYLAITPARTANISNNLMGCNSNSEILASCVTAFPVSLVSFYATLKDRNAILKWRVASAQGLDSYEPQHSTDGVYFKTLDRVLASRQVVPLQTQEWVHHSPPAGLNYYRLKLIEQDAEYSYSEVVKLYNGHQIQVFPNPTRDKFYISGISIYPASVEIHDLLGRTIWKSMVSEGQALDLSNQPGGIYMVSILTGDKKVVFRVIHE